MRSCGDYQNQKSGNAFNSNWSSSNTNYGPFYLNNNAPSNTNAALGFALRKYKRHTAKRNRGESP